MTNMPDDRVERRVSPTSEDEFFAHSGLNALVIAAARAAPTTVLVRDDAGAVSAADLDARVRQLASTMRLAGLMAGERVCVSATSEIGTLAAMLAALRAGLEPAMMPAGLSPVEIAAHATACEASALVGPSLFCNRSCGEDYLNAAALAETIRFVATFGSEAVDGALDITFDPNDRSMNENVVGVLEAPMITTFAGPCRAPTSMAHRQAAMFADALSLVEQAHILPSHRVMSLVPPISLAGLVLGPFAAFVGASSLIMHGPFSSGHFLSTLDAEGEVHLAVPARFGAAFAAPQIAVGLTSLLLLSRHADMERFVAPTSFVCDRPVVDLYAFGEDTVLAQKRIDGQVRVPARVADNTLADGLGSRLNRARAEARLASFHRT